MIIIRNVDFLHPVGKIAAPHRNAVAYTGDGAWGMQMNEVRTVFYCPELLQMLYSEMTQKIMIPTPHHQSESETPLQILTCVREDIPVTAVVFNNGQWGAEKKNQVLWFGDRSGHDFLFSLYYPQIKYLFVPYYLTLSFSRVFSSIDYIFIIRRYIGSQLYNPWSYADIARSMHAEGITCTHEDQVTDALLWVLRVNLCPQFSKFS